MPHLPDLGGTVLMVGFTLFVTVLAIAGFVATAARMLP